MGHRHSALDDFNPAGTYPVPMLWPRNLNKEAKLHVYLLVWHSFEGYEEGAGYWMLYFDASDSNGRYLCSNIQNVEGKLVIEKYYGYLFYLALCSDRNLIQVIDEEWTGAGPSQGTFNGAFPVTLDRY